MSRVLKTRVETPHECRMVTAGSGAGADDWRVGCLAGTTSEGRIRLFSIGEIVYCGRQGRRGYLRTEEGEFFSAFSLEKLERRLRPFGFFRSHRCFLVNLAWVEAVVIRAHSTYDLVLRDRAKSLIPLSRNRAREMRQMLPGGRCRF